jgi:hypothetical protein
MTKINANDNIQTQQASPKPNSDLKSLDRLVGTWKVSDPSGSGSVSGRVTYEWMEGGFFLIQHVELEQNGQPIKGIEVIGHEQTFGAEPSKEIKSRYYDNIGNTLDYVYEADGETLTIWAGEKGSPAYYKGKWSADGKTNTGAWVYPGGGGYKSSMTRVEK